MSTALVPIALGKRSSGANAGPGRPRADFLAHLIATAAQAPQTRIRRRAEPEQAIAAYGAIARRAVVRPPTLSRSL